MIDTTETPRYLNRGSEIWEKTDRGEREIFAADVVKRLTDLERQLAEAREQLAEWRTLATWGGTPEIINDFIRGQQTRIHAAQNAEEQRDRLAEAVKRVLPHLPNMEPIGAAAHAEANLAAWNLRQTLATLDCRGIGTANTHDYGKKENIETGNGGSR